MGSVHNPKTTFSLLSCPLWFTRFPGVGVYALVVKGAYLFFIAEVQK